MSIEHRYEGALVDMMSLLQEALVRFLTQRQVDLDKFKQYFLKFRHSMATIEEQFHDGSLKLSKNLEKLREVCENFKESMQPVPKPNLKKISQAATLGLNSIKQQEEDIAYNSRKRSGTANGSRPIKWNCEKSRPTTGKLRGVPQRSRSGNEHEHSNTHGSMHAQTLAQEFPSQTITVQSAEQNSRKIRFYESEKAQADIFQTMPVERISGRKSFYDELEKETHLFECPLRLPPRKQRSGSQKIWFMKINKLF